MRWPFLRPPSAPPAPPAARLPHARPIGVDAGVPVFACSTCGRTDLAAVGDWDPPICEECDAAINFDAEEELLEDGRA